MLASSRPSSLTGVPVLGDTTCDAGSSSCPSILPGHQEPFRRRTHTMVPGEQSSMPPPSASPSPPPAPPSPPELRPMPATNPTKRNPRFASRSALRPSPLPPPPDLGFRRLGEASRSRSDNRLLLTWVCRRDRRRPSGGGLAARELYISLTLCFDFLQFFPCLRCGLL
jgi:hypothetical protein